MGGVITAQLKITAPGDLVVELDDNKNGLQSMTANIDHGFATTAFVDDQTVSDLHEVSSTFLSKLITAAG